MLKIHYVNPPVKPLHNEDWAVLPINSNTTYYISTKGRLYSMRASRLLKGKDCDGNLAFEYSPTMDKCSLEQVREKSAKKRKSTLTVTFQRLVAITFIPKPKGKNIVLHKDKNKRNNCVSNLEWGTYSFLASALGKMHYNQEVGKKLNANQVLQIRKKLKAKKRPKVKDLASMYGISEMSVFRIQNGHCWKYVGGFIKPKIVPKKFSKDEVTAIRDLLSEGVPGIKIASLYKTTETTISRIKRNVYYQA